MSYDHAFDGLRKAMTALAVMVPDFHISSVPDINISHSLGFILFPSIKLTLFILFKFSIKVKEQIVSPTETAYLTKQILLPIRTFVVPFFFLLDCPC